MEVLEDITEVDLLERKTLVKKTQCNDLSRFLSPPETVSDFSCLTGVLGPPLPSQSGPMFRTY